MGRTADVSKLLGAVLLVVLASSSASIAKTSDVYVSPSIRIAATPTQCCGWDVHIAASPIDSNILVASNGIGVYYSNDGGLHWVTTWRGGSGDPSLAYDSNGAAFFTRLQARPELHITSYVAVMKSPNGGSSWNQPVTIASSPDSTVFFLDKPWIAVDTSNSSFRNRVYLAFLNITQDTSGGLEWPQSEKSSDIIFSYSGDGGLTFSKPRRLVVGDPIAGSGPYVAVGPSGEVYVIWQVGSPDGEWIKILKSMDGGASFPGEGRKTLRAPTAVSVVRVPRYLPNTKFRVPPLPVLAVDPKYGYVYLAWHDYRFGDADILFSRSVDGGRTWARPVRVNDDPLRNGSDQFMPAIALSREGVIHLVFLDRRNDPRNISYDMYYAKSLDQGRSFGPNVRVTDFSSDPNTLSDPSFIGDYIGLASDASGNVHPVWNGVRNGLGYTFTAIISSAQIITATSSLSSVFTQTAPSSSTSNVPTKSLTMTTESPVVVLTGSSLSSFATVGLVAIFVGATGFMLMRYKRKVTTRQT